MREADELRLALGGVLAPPEAIVKHDLRIIMVKQGQLANLLTFKGAVEFAVDGRGKFINFDKRHHDCVEASENLHDTTRLPPNAVYVTVQQDETGRIATIAGHTQNEVTGGRSALMPLPRRMRFVMTDPEGGFVRFDVKPSQEPGQWNRQFRLAPKEGYVHEWELDTKELSKLPFFYFKTGGKYGKGRISRVSISRDSKTALCHVEFYLQPNGSRNVETGSWGS